VGDDQTLNFETMARAGSYHSGGVNVPPLDGSVRVVKNGIGPMTWPATAACL
jgi:hypothetical protein